MAEPAQTSLLAFLFTDIVGSTELKRRLGDVEGAQVIAAHDAAFRECVAKSKGVEQNNPGDGFFATFPVPSAALTCALAFQDALAKQSVAARVGIHMGEAVHVPGAGDDPKLLGLAVDTAGRVMSLALPKQILITRHAFDSARQQVLQGPNEQHVVWRAHGPYRFKGLDEPIEIHEAGIKGVAPLSPPPDSQKAQRAIAPGDDETLGWRPGVGLDIPSRAGWRLERELGAGGFGEVWLAISKRTKERRAFKFCYRADRLRTLKRELTLFRLLKEALGERDDIARLYDVRLDEAPFFLEMEYTADGSLDRWAAKHESLKSMSLDDRAQFVAEVAEALGAAHSVGVLHKDVKPSNILVRKAADGRPHARLTDFGIGQLLDPAVLKAAQVTAAGFTETGALTDLGSRTGTRLYMAPELFAGKPASIASDVYALGVLLYQMIVGDLNRPLGQGWERDISDPFLVEDIAACVAGKPKQRPVSCDLVAKGLRSLKARRLRRAKKERRIAADARRARLFRLTTVAAAVLLVATVAGFVVAGILDQRRRQAEEARTEAEEARTEAEEARTEAEVERDAKARALAQVLRLSADREVRDLFDKMDDLWPVHPDLAPVMAEWLERARAVLENRAGHEEELKRLRKRARGLARRRRGRGRQPHTEEQRKKGRAIEIERLDAQMLSDLLAELHRLDAAQRRLARRHEAALTLEARSIDAHRQDWNETIQAIAASSKYSGLKLVAQLGLVPLGPDAESGLYEFAQLGTGTIPERNPKTKRFLLTDEFALVLVLVPGGTLRMGAQKEDPEAPNYDPQAKSDESPVHSVTLSPYFLSKYECTQSQWLRLGRGSPSGYGRGKGMGGKKVTLRNPVERVSWNDCKRWLWRYNLALPTEAQWEYACRAGMSTPWFSGREVKSLEKIANIADAFCKANGGGATWPYSEEINDGFTLHAPVGSLGPNVFGLFDVHGNVAEWCRDAWATYPDGAVTNPFIDSTGAMRVLRGGCWSFVASFARSAARDSTDPTVRRAFLGVRPARSVTSK